MAGLKDIQEVLKDPQLKLTQAKDVRWLSHEKAVWNLRQCLPSVLASLERATWCTGSWAGFVKDSSLWLYFYFYFFVWYYTTISSTLSRAFQNTNIDFSIVKLLGQGSKDCISDLQASHGEMFSIFWNVQNLVAHGFQELTEERMSRFKQALSHYCYST